MNIMCAPIVEMYGPVVIGPGATKSTTAYQLKRLNTTEKEAITKAKKYAMEQNIRTVLLKQTRQHEVQQMINIKRTQAMVLLSRIYVGSINYDVKEDTIRQSFNCFGPVKSVSLSYDPITQKHMGYAFIEFEYPEGAQLSVSQTTGITIGGRQCKVGRPTNMPHSGPLVEELYSEANRLARIYVANVHPNLSSEDLKSVFEAFGPIESCALQPDLTRPGKHRSFGFIQYKTHQAAQEAMMAMNMFDLGGQLLRVAKAITPPNLVVLPAATASGVGAMATSQMPAAAAVAAASITAQVQALEVQQISDVTGEQETANGSGGRKEKTARKKFSETKVSNEAVGTSNLIIPEKMVVEDRSRHRSGSASRTNADNVQVKMDVEDSCGPGYLKTESLEVDNIKISGREARTQMMQKLLRKRATVQRTLVLKNMIDRDDIDDSIEEEVKEECCKFGEVIDVRIIVEDVEEQTEEEDCLVREEVKIFVVFETTEALQEAISRMDGRYFGGRIVQAAKYDQELYDAGDYSG